MPKDYRIVATKRGIRQSSPRATGPTNCLPNKQRNLRNRKGSYKTDRQLVTDEQVESVCRFVNKTPVIKKIFCNTVALFEEEVN